MGGIRDQYHVTQYPVHCVFVSPKTIGLFNVYRHGPGDSRKAVAIGRPRVCVREGLGQFGEHQFESYENHRRRQRLGRSLQRGSGNWTGSRVGQ